MDLGIVWRTLVVQALAVGLLFVVLLALPLEREFFRDYGSLIGPLAWAAAAFVTARVLSLPLELVLLAALAAGCAGLAAGLVVGHGPGLIVSLPLFAGGCAVLMRGWNREPNPGH